MTPDNTVRDIAETLARADAQAAAHEAPAVTRSGLEALLKVVQDRHQSAAASHAALSAQLDGLAARMQVARRQYAAAAALLRELFGAAPPVALSPYDAADDLPE